MEELDVPASSEAYEYLLGIRDQIVQLFGVPVDEATARMNRYWAGQSFLQADDLAGLEHEAPEFWAKWIYFGRVRFWLHDEATLPPEPFP